MFFIPPPAWLRMFVSSIAWMSRTLAPWCAAGGLLLSFTAIAGQETAFGASSNPGIARAALAPEDLIPARRALVFGAIIPGDYAFDSVLPGIFVQEARLVTGSSTDLGQGPDEIAPKHALKSQPGVKPEVNRSARGDPFVGLRPTFGTRLRGPGDLAVAQASALLFGVDDSQPVSAFETGAQVAALGGMAESFETGYGQAYAGRLHAAPPAFEDGATPPLARAVTLAATTPGTPDVTPVTVSIVVLTQPISLTIVERAPDQPDFAALINPKTAEDEAHCLAQAIYFEARSEPQDGMAAVAQVVLNRVKSGLYADSVCGVVFQNQHRYKACQFSFACEGKSLRINDPLSWQTAERIAREVTTGATWLADVGNSTHYHANYVRPYWASQLHRMDKIGHHIFYRQRNG